MPPLKVCGGSYSVLFAGDDLRIISLGGIALRVIQIGFLIPSFLLLLFDQETNTDFYQNANNHNNNNNNNNGTAAASEKINDINNNHPNSSSNNDIGIAAQPAMIYDNIYNSNTNADYDNNYTILQLEEERDSVWFARNVLWIFWGLSMSTAVFSIITDAIIFRISSRGNMVDEHNERANLPILCAIKLFPLSILRILALIAAIMALVHVKDYCHQSMHIDDNINNNDSYSNENEIEIPVEYVCPRYSQTVALIIALGWIHILESLFTAVMYMYVACQLAHRGSRRVLRFLTKRTVTTNTSKCYWHWSLLCRFTCTITSLCTCCFLGGREVIFRGDFTDIAMVLTEFLDFGPKEDYDIGDDNLSSSSPNNNREATSDDMADSIRQRQHQHTSEPIISVTTTDMLAGLLLVAEDQRVQRREKSLKIYIEQQRRRKPCDPEEKVQHHGMNTFTEQYNHSTTDNKAITIESDSIEVKHDETLGIIPEQAYGSPKSTVRGVVLCRTPSNVDNLDFSDSVESQNEIVDPNVETDESERHDESRYYYEVSERNCLTIDDAPLLRDAAHYLQLSMSIYGSIMYLYAGEKDTCCCSIFSCLKLCQGSVNRSCNKCCRSNQKDDHVVRGGDCFGCNEVALVAMAGDGMELAYANFRTGLRRCPYCILLDHIRREVVIVVQGTFSLESAVADLSIRPANIWETLCQDPANFANNIDSEYNSLMGEYCHSGVLQCAIKLKKDLEKHQKLDQLLLGESAQYPSYKLVCTGHSLGAGIAAVLSILMEQSMKKHGIELSCLCFCPPGCTLTKKSAEREYITSFVLDSDIVPRLSLHSMEGLRNNVLEMIARAKIPKHEIYYRNLFSTQQEKLFSPQHSLNMRDQQWRRESGIYDTNPIFHRRESIAVTDFSKQLKNYLKYQKKAKADRKVLLEDVKLVIPGKRIVHVVRDRTITWEESDNTLLKPIRRRPKRVKQYTAIWAKADDFAEIQLSKSFLVDHFPDTFCDKLLMVADSLLEAESKQDR